MDSSAGSPWLYEKQAEQAMEKKPVSRTPPRSLPQFFPSGSCSSSYFVFPQCWTMNRNVEAKPSPPTHRATPRHGVYHSQRRGSKTSRCKSLGHRICPSSYCIHPLCVPTSCGQHEGVVWFQHGRGYPTGMMGEECKATRSRMKSPDAAFPMRSQVRARALG